MNAYLTLTETIEAALEIALIVTNINNAVDSGEVSAEDAREIKQSIMEAQ